MILRTLRSGLLATVAVLAFLPAAAGAAPASAAAPYPASAAIGRHHVRHTYPAPYRMHHHRYVTHHARHMYRVHRLRHFGAQAMTYRFVPRTTAQRWAVPGAGYRIAGVPTRGRL
ncbi:hypothetical protein ACFC0P_26890, partial [Streptomyces broussonetiae]